MKNIKVDEPEEFTHSAAGVGSKVLQRSSIRGCKKDKFCQNIPLNS